MTLFTFLCVNTKSRALFLSETRICRVDLRARMGCKAAELWSAAKRHVCDVVMHCLSRKP